jgi:SOS-response transcriptional repressors (RecA-mediated autopeptidases)
MTIGDRIKQRRIKIGMTVDELAAKLNKNRATIYRYESNDIENFPTTILEPLANALEISPAYLMGWNDEDNVFSIENILPIETRKFPLLGEISCGIPQLAEEHFDGYIEVGANIQADFCLKAKGDSMINARINDGDIIFVKKQSDVNNGEIAVVYMDGETTLKRVFKYPDLIILRSENPKYKEKEIYKKDFDTLCILGKAVAFQSDVK